MSGIITEMDTLIAGIISVNATIKVVINIVIPPASEHFGFRDRYKRSINIYNNALADKYVNQESNRIFINTAFCLHVDPYYSYPTTTELKNPYNSGSGELIQVNYIHPSLDGYKMMGDAMWSNIKYITTT